MNEGLVEMFRYNAWANRQFFEACSTLSDQQLDTHLAGTSGSVRELLMHIAGGQQTFILRTMGRQNEGELGRWSKWPGMEAVVAIAGETSDALIMIAEQLKGGEEVELSYRGKSYRFPKRFFLVHALEHGVHHRTEVKVALGSMGVKLPSLDSWNYAGAAGYGAEVLPT